MIILKTIEQSEKPYWIIVSDEGPAQFPYQHDSWDSAYDESIRLSKVKPGMKFNVFKYVGHTESEKPVEPRTTFKTYSVPQPYWGWASYPPMWNRQSDATIPF